MNFSELARSLTGFAVFAAPPLFLISLVLLIQRRAYGWRFPRRFVILALLFLLFGLTNIVAGKFDVFSARQIIAYLVSCLICFVTYAEARRGGFGSAKVAIWLLSMYFFLFCLFYLELFLGIGKGIYYFITTLITANPADAWQGYLMGPGFGRFFYLQPEPRVAALGIFATTMPFLLASFRLSRRKSSVAAILFALFVGALTNSFTATGLMLLSIAFMFWERGAFFAALCLTLLITVIVPGIVGSLVLMGNLERVIGSALGGQMFGMVSAGTLTTTAVTIYIAVKAYLSNPIFGLGIGGYAGYFYNVVPTMGIAKSSEITQKILGVGLSSDYVPTPQNFVMKILAENGAVGAILMIIATWWLYRFAFAPDDNNADRVALRFVAAAIVLSWQAYTSFLNPLFWVAAGLIGAIHHRELIVASSESQQDEVKRS